MKKLIITMFFLYTSFTLSQIINIPTDQPTIQAGINTAVDGDTILVAEGTYYENVLIENKSVTLASYFFIDQDSSHIRNTIINGSQPVNTDEATTVTISMSADTSILCGFTITGGYGHKVSRPDGKYNRLGGGIGIVASNAIVCNNRVINNVITNSKVPEKLCQKRDQQLVLPNCLRLT